jgi:CRISPR/Cas system-associated exonuclease Cas4 (RecB family)
MADLKNELTWSYSRLRMFSACRRQYYYHYYLKWGGWDRKAPAVNQTAYRLSKMKSMPILVGEIVHGVIEEILQRYRRNGVTMTVEEALAAATLRWQRALDSSRKEEWQNNNKATCLMEDYYEFPDRDRRIELCTLQIAECLRNFYESRTWASLQKSRPENWIAQDGDPFQKAMIDGVPMFGRPDLAYKPHNPDGTVSACRIFDWKTGRPREADVVQVRYYALFAQDVWHFPIESIRARLVYLYPDVIENQPDITVEAIDDARNVIKLSFADMQSVLHDVATNTPLSIKHFPVTQQTWRCRHCVFAEICIDHPRPAEIEPDDLCDDEDLVPA